MKTEKKSTMVTPNQLVSDIIDSRVNHTGVVEVPMNIVENLITSRAVFWITDSLHDEIIYQIENSERFYHCAPASFLLNEIMNFKSDDIESFSSDYAFSNNDLIITDDITTEVGSSNYRMSIVVNPTQLAINNWLNLTETVKEYLENGFQVFIHQKVV